MNIVWKGSPNYDKNRKTIDRVVVHWFGVGTLESANTRFQSATNGVSAHYGISSDIIWQWVKEEHVAYHAGVYTMNQRSIGIEHDATTTKNPTEETYKTSGQLVREICQKHNIPIDREHIIGHKEIKATQCPGVMDIDKIIDIAKKSNGIIEEMITDQTKIDLGDLGVLEVQAIKSKLKDQENTINSLKMSTASLNEKISQLEAKVAELTSIIDKAPQNSSSSPTIDSNSANILSQIGSWLSSIFGNNAK